MVFATAIWMLTTSPQRIAAGLLAIGPLYKLELALSSTTRFIPVMNAPVMNAERATILEAQRPRAGPVPGRSDQAPLGPRLR